LNARSSNLELCPRTFGTTGTSGTIGTALRVEKTGARQSEITHSAGIEKGNKKKFSQERLCLLTCLLMGDPGQPQANQEFFCSSVRACPKTFIRLLLVATVSADYC
jgi:hypothetical protein